MISIFNTPASFDRMARELDRVLDQALAGSVRRLLAADLGQPVPATTTPSGWPGMNVWRDADTIVAEAEIPGFRLEDIEILATDDSLTVRGQRSATAPEGATPLRIERTINRFERTVRLPIQINPDAVRAALSNGVLRVSMPVIESARPRRIAIQPSHSELNAAQQREALPPSCDQTPRH